MKRIIFIFFLSLLSAPLLHAQGFSLDDSTITFKNKDGKVLNKGEATELMKGKFSMETETVDGKKIVTIIPVDQSEIAEREKFLENLRKNLVGRSIDSLQFTDINGGSFSRKNARGKVIVMNFWFTSCKPCIAELPMLNELVDAYKSKEVVFIAPALDKESSVKKFLEKYKFSYRVMPDQISYIQKLKVTVFPTHIIADRKGIIQQVEVGYNKDIKEKLSKAIDGLLEY